MEQDATDEGRARADWDPAKDPDRRQMYRTALESGDVVLVEVVGESGTTNGDILDLSLQGAAVILDNDQPVFRIGERVSLTFRAQGEQPLVVEAAVRVRHDLARYRRYGLFFDDRAALRARLSDGFRRFFNQRRTVRVEPEAPMYATLRIPGEDSSATGRVLDLSEGGCRAMIGKEVEGWLAPVNRITIEFCLPGHRLPLTFTASIRHRSSDLDGDDVCLGLRFDRDQVVDFEAQQRCVAGYVGIRRTQLAAAS